MKTLTFIAATDALHRDRCKRKSSLRTVAINAVNSNSGGGKSIRDSYLKLLNETELEERYVVFVAKGADLAFVTNPNIEVIELPGLYSQTIMAPIIYRFVLGRILNRIGVDVVLNLGNLIIRTRAKQLSVFQWSFGVDVHEKVWAGMLPVDRLSRKAKLWLLERYFHEADVVVAQTEFIRQRLIEKYRLNDVRVIGNAPTLGGVTDESGTAFDLPVGVRLVYPCVYYPHKNLEILLDVAELIKARKLNYRIITTINPGGPAASRFVGAIAERGLQDVIRNIGQVPPGRMPALYEQCDALLMPTLLESFSIVYPEAMHHGLPILTSDMWFAHSVCGDAAKYFDPFDAANILRSIEEVFSDNAVRSALVETGRRQLASTPTWPENFAAYQAIIDELLATG